MKRWTFLGLVLILVTVGLPTGGCSSAEEEESGGSTPSGEPAPGVTDTEILLGTHMTLSGSPAAGMAPIADGMRAYYDYVNSQGGINGRKIKLVVGDDHFSPPDAVEVARRLVEQDGVFAIVGGIGDPVHLAVMDYLAEKGVPDLFVGAGVSRFSDPVVKTRFAMTDYDTETRIISDYFKENFAGQRMAILVPETESGTGALAAFEEDLKDSDIEIVSVQTYDIVQFDVTAQMQRLKADNPDFVYLWANIGVAANAIKVIRELLSWDVPLLISQVAATEVLTALTGPENAEGVLSMTSGKMISETDDPGIQRHIEMMKQFAPDVKPNGNTLYGMTIAELAVQALKNAGPDLTRESVIEGAEKIRDYCCTTCLAPVNLSPTDHRVSEALWFERVVDGNWVRLSDTPVSYESTPGDVVACKGAGEPVYKDE